MVRGPLTRVRCKNTSLYCQGIRLCLLKAGMGSEQSLETHLGAGSPAVEENYTTKDLGFAQYPTISARSCGYC